MRIDSPAARDSEWSYPRTHPIRFWAGLALVATSMVLIAGFLVLTYSAFTMNSDMAFMTAVTIVFALLADFLLLPPLLMALDGKEKSNA